MNEEKLKTLRDRFIDGEISEDTYLQLRKELEAETTPETHAEAVEEPPVETVEEPPQDQPSKPSEEPVTEPAAGEPATTPAPKKSGGGGKILIVLIVIALVLVVAYQQGYIGAKTVTAKEFMEDYNWYAHEFESYDGDEKVVIKDVVSRIEYSPEDDITYVYFESIEGSGYEAWGFKGDITYRIFIGNEVKVTLHITGNYGNMAPPDGNTIINDDSDSWLEWVEEAESYGDLILPASTIKKA